MTDQEAGKLLDAMLDAFYAIRDEQKNCDLWMVTRDDGVHLEWRKREIGR